MNIEWLSYGPLYDADVSTVPFVGLETKHSLATHGSHRFKKINPPYPYDRISPPVSPVDVISEESDGEWMRERVVTPEDFSVVQAVVRRRMD